MTPRWIRESISSGKITKTRKAKNHKNQTVTKIHFTELPADILHSRLAAANDTEIRAAAGHNYDLFDPGEALERFDLIEPILTGESTAKDLAAGSGYSARTLQDWAQKYREAEPGQRMRTLATKRRSDRGATRALEPEIAADFRAMWMTEEQRSVRRCHTYLTKQYGERMPSYRTLLRYSESLPAEVITFTRKGKKAWEDRHEPLIQRDLSTFDVGEVYVGDHHELDILIQDHGNLRRPWLTAWMDLRTRAIVGWHISTNPNSDTIALALAEACQPGEHDGMGGVPQTVYIDNGKDYRAKRFNRRNIRHDREQKIGRISDNSVMKGFYKEWGIKRVHAMPYRARSKPIERYFRTLTEGFSKFCPAYLASSPKARPESLQKKVNNFYSNTKPQARAKAREYFLTIGDLRSKFERWVYEDYHLEEHSMLGKSPLAEWKGNAKPLRLITEKSLTVSLWPSRTATVQQSGVQAFGTRKHPNFYWHPELPGYRGQKIEVKYNPEDIAILHAFDTEGTYLFPLVNNELAGRDISESDYKAMIREQSRERKRVKEEAERLRRAGTDRNPVVRYKNMTNAPEPDEAEAKAVNAGVTQISKFDLIETEEISIEPKKDNMKFFDWQTEDD
jgi:putative transposase